MCRQGAFVRTFSIVAVFRCVFFCYVSSVRIYYGVWINSKWKVRQMASLFNYFKYLLFCPPGLSKHLLLFFPFKDQLRSNFPEYNFWVATKQFTFDHEGQYNTKTGRCTLNPPFTALMLLLLNYIIINRVITQKNHSLGKNPRMCYSFSYATAGGTVKSKCFVSWLG
jgi:hypothetical protein